MWLTILKPPKNHAKSIVVGGGKGGVHSNLCGVQREPLAKWWLLKPREAPRRLCIGGLSQRVGHQRVASPSRRGVGVRPSGYLILVDMWVEHDVDLGLNCNFQVVGIHASEEQWTMLSPPSCGKHVSSIEPGHLSKPLYMTIRCRLPSSSRWWPKFVASAFWSFDILVGPMSKGSSYIYYIIIYIQRERKRERTLQGHILSYSPFELACRVALNLSS